ncbi:NADP-dependent aryl-alcohol dehydrogenase [Parapedobacter pyrenivorans]|uniref:NADP-dependent aryl-alcohol dehydrogenase n=1 Tax=Parapedobacter pyrenivorans TaxID=1305674 RepID=A0A917MFT2_9SPHI|nr:aldo/keto reductase [Parapedobacter pyrenivorans]GGG97905.1 NADP-dependent aryl-alcohol dehydrogenase [Parapedobacter pyrenivorans]
MTTNKRILGKSDLHVSPIAFGGNVFGWTLDKQQSFRMLDAFTDAGFNFIDTADTYSTWVPGNQGGESETIIGQWLKEHGKRDELIIATKLGGEMGAGRKGLSASYIHEAVEASLKRLGTDYIDLYQSHYDDPETPVDETIEAFNVLIKSGKVRYIGASNLPADRITESNRFAAANGFEGYASLQPLYNLYDRQLFEAEYLSLVQAEGLGVITYYALASGFLSGKYRNEGDLGQSPRGGGVKKYLDARGLRILDALDQVAGESMASPAQVALAWQLSKPYVTAPIASATSEQQLDDLIAAANLDLTTEQVVLLDKASAY